MSKSDRRCKTCRFYGHSGGGEPGYCLWAQNLPPVLRQMLAAAEAEPSARIAHTVFDGMEISTDKDHCCSGWQA